MTTSVVILTRNAGPAFAATVDAIVAQVPPADELVVIDSGSTDATVAYARAGGARVHEIPVAEFDFGLTRDLGFSLATGDLVVSLSQDVVPKDASWLAALTAPFADPRVAYASARCEARDPERMFLWQRLGRFYFTREMARYRERYGVPCSNANSCARRSVWATLRHGPMPIAEDLLFQKRVIEAGYLTAQVERPIAWHQHAYGAVEVLKRAYNEGHAARILGIAYGAGDAVADGLRLDIGLTLLRQLRYGRVRGAADLLYPWLRPAAVYLGHRFGRGYWRYSMARARVETIVAAVGFALLTVLMTWPVAARVLDAVPMYNDVWIFVWDVHWVRAALLDPALAVFETNQVFHPHGISLAFHTLAPLYGLAAIPLEPVVGLVGSHNVLWLLTFASSGVAAFLLARSLEATASGAFLAGALYAFSPFHQAHAPHLNLLSIQFLPLVAWGTLRFVDSGAWRHALAIVAGGVLSLYACHEYGLFAALLAMTLFAHAIVTRGRSLRPRLLNLLGRAGAAAALAAAAAAPLVIPMLAEAAIESHYAERVDVQFSADLLSWLTPSVLHSLWGGYTMKVYQHFPGVLAEWTTFLGVTVVGLCAIGGVRRRDRLTTAWLAVVAVFGLLAMGPSLRILGVATAVPLPYRLLAELPVLSAMREPSRFAAGVTLATAMLAARGFDHLRCGRFPRLTLLLLPLALLEFLQVPYPMTDARTPAFYQTIANDGDDYAVLDVPAGLELREHLYHQAVHGKRIFVGYVARIPEANRRFIATTPLLADPATWDLGSQSDSPRAAELARAASELRVRYALVHRAFYARRGQPERYSAAIDNLLRLPGARVAAREDGFTAIRIDGR